jgi:hypothetical protein
MSRPKSRWLLLLLLLAAAQARAQDNELEKIFQDANLESLIDRALQLNITAKVLPPDQSPAWNSVSQKVTLPGRSVAVRVVGENLRIDAVFTPYEEEDGTLVLVAQGQVWYSEAKETRYLTTFQSVPVGLGEKVLFFPLGLSEPLSQKTTFTMQIEVEIFPYKQLLKKEKHPLLPIDPYGRREKTDQPIL